MGEPTTISADREVPPFPYRVVVGRVYAVHGLLLLLFSLIMPLAANQMMTAEWAEAMNMVGAGHYVSPARQIVPAVAQWASIIAAFGLACMVGGVVTWVWRLVWPVDLLAVVHLVVLPLASWWGHVRVDQAGMGSIANTIGEVFFFLVTMATVVFGVWVTRRRQPFGAGNARAAQPVNPANAGGQALPATSPPVEPTTPPTPNAPRAGSKTSDETSSEDERKFW